MSFAPNFPQNQIFGQKYLSSVQENHTIPLAPALDWYFTEFSDLRKQKQHSDPKPLLQHKKAYYLFDESPSILWNKGRETNRLPGLF